MRVALTFVFVTIIFCFGRSQEPEAIVLSEDEKALDEIFSKALTSSNVYPWLESMCLDIGPRLSGSPQAEQAVDYSYSLMSELGLNPVKQPVMVPKWVRGPREEGYIFSNDDDSTRVRLLALGGSVPTASNGISAEIIEVSNWDQLEELGREKIEGNVVFFNEKMNPENLYTFHSYGHCVKHRWGGAVEAAKYGAVGAIVRSLNLRIDTFPHTGSMTYENAMDSIPAAAISTYDAEILSKTLAEEPVRLYWKQQCETFDDVPSHNVFGEIKGTDHPEKIILLGGHLDSWDVGHGAHDDGAGVMQSLATLELLQSLGYKPKHTIRVVFFMNEENGLRGAKEYARVAEESGLEHVACIESDRGGFTPRGFHAEGNPKLVQQIIDLKPLLDKYGLHQLTEGGSGADIKPLQTESNVLIGFVPDSQRYFDHHHSANDTFDQVNKRELELGVASITALVYMLDKYGLD